MFKLMALNEMMVDYGAQSNHTPEFLGVLEDHLTYLRTHEDTTVVSVANQEAERWAGDLNGFLFSKNVDARLHFITMRLSGMVAPSDFGVDINTLTIPSAKVINTIRKIENTRKNIRL
jgi:hypothetical protein